MDANIDACRERFSELLRAAYDEKQPIDRSLAIAAAECGAYLIDRIVRPAAHGQLTRDK